MIWSRSARISWAGADGAYFDDLVPGKCEIRNVGGVARHEVPVQHPQDALVRDQQDVVPLAFKLEDDRFQTNCQIVI